MTEDELVAFVVAEAERMGRIRRPCNREFPIVAIPGASFGYASRSDLHTRRLRLATRPFRWCRFCGQDDDSASVPPMRGLQRWKAQRAAFRYHVVDCALRWWASMDAAPESRSRATDMAEGGH